MSTHPRAQAFIEAYGIAERTQVLDIDTSDGHRFVVLNQGNASWLFDIASVSDHHFIYVHLFDNSTDAARAHVGTAAEDNPDGPTTPVGVFSIADGKRVTFEETGLTNHGWPAVPTLTLLADRCDG